MSNSNTVVEMVVPNNPEDRKKIMDAMQEISNSKTRMEAERDLVKETITDLSEKYGIPKKLLNRFAKTYHKQSYREELDLDSEFESMVELLVKVED